MTLTNYTERLEALRAELEGTAPRRPPTPTRTVGWSVHSASLVDADGFPIGGTVVEVIEGTSPETGEKFRKYLVARPVKAEVCWALIEEGDVAQGEPPNSYFVVDVIRAMLQEVAMNGCKRRAGGTLPYEHRELIAHAWRLVGVL